MRLIIALNVAKKADKPLFMHGKISNCELVKSKNTNGNFTLNSKKLNMSIKKPLQPQFNTGEVVIFIKT